VRSLTASRFDIVSEDVLNTRTEVESGERQRQQSFQQILTRNWWIAGLVGRTSETGSSEQDFPLLLAPQSGF